MENIKMGIEFILGVLYAIIRVLFLAGILYFGVKEMKRYKDNHKDDDSHK